MTAEFNITIPGAEIIKRLADLENNQRITNATVSSVIDNYDRLADRLDDFEIEMSTKTNTLSDRMDVLTDIAHGRVRPADAPDDFASASRVERIETDLAILRRELNLALANGGEELRQVNDRIERGDESLGAYIQRVETDLGERLTAVDRARARGDDGQHDLVTRTANSIYAEIKRLEQRLSDCELAVGTDKLDGAPTPNIPANDPEPVDTSWHPYDARFDGPARMHPDGNQRVVALLRDNTMSGPNFAEVFYWEENGPETIVAWRYAKEGE